MEKVTQTLLSKEVRICSDTSGFHGFVKLYRHPQTNHHYGTFHADSGAEYTVIPSPALAELWEEDSDFALIAGLEADIDPELGTMRIRQYLCLQNLESAGEVACSFQMP